MNQQMQIYVFGDQNFDVSSNFRDLLSNRNNPFLDLFFKRAGAAIRVEVGKLPQVERTQLPLFSSLADLVALRRQESLHPSLDQAVSCAYQLAHFISICTRNAGLYPEPSKACVVGLCTGSLAAAAVSCCRTLYELLPVAVYTVKVAFQAGMSASNMAKSIRQTCGTTKAWSITVLGLEIKTAMEILDEFSQEHQLPVASKPYISSSSSRTISISGPPDILQEIQATRRLSCFKTSEIGVYAPYHAPHLFNEKSFDDMLEAPEQWSDYKMNLPALSSASGTLIRTNNLEVMLRAALADIFLKPIDMESIAQGLAFISRSTPDSQLSIHPIGTGAQITLQNSLGREESISSGGSRSLLTPEPSPRPRASSDSSTNKSKIAIIGMSGRFPASEDANEFWKVLEQGLDVHRVVPSTRWDVSTHVDITSKRKNTSATPYGCWLENPGLFDPKFFHISPREAPEIDPAQRMALLTAYEALEQAGIVPGATPSTQKDRVGVFFGVTSNDWMETNSAQEIDVHLIPGGNRAFIPGRVNYFFKFSGPSYSVDTACSSSLSAIHLACNFLWQGDADMIIAGGTNVITNPDFTAGLDRGQFLSRTGNCKTFDEGADGYCRGESVCSVILKRLEDAQADNDPILGVIMDTATNHNAEAQSITRPCIEAQRSIFDKILNNTNVDPREVSYVEMHGTGTQAGDFGEMSSVLGTFAPPPRTRHARQDHQPLYLGSAKSCVGHGEAAAGVTSLIKVLLMMKNDLIPPHCGIKTSINSRFPINLEERNVFIAKESVEWKRPGKGTRKVFVNNFSAAGGNSALLLEDAPLDQSSDHGEDSRSSHIITVSAKSAKSLIANTTALISFLDSSSNDRNFLSALSYTTTARRMHHPHRIIVSGSGIDDVKSKLRTAIEQGAGHSRSKSSPKIVFAFTGQGSQYLGMGKQLIESFSSLRSDIDRFDRIAQNQGFPSTKPFFSSSSIGTAEEFSPVVVQIASLSLQMALARLWTSWGVLPSSVVGHSLGQYAAMNVAGVLSEADAIFLVGKRASLLVKHCTGGTHAMLAVEASPETVGAFLENENIEIACINGPNSIVLSGENSDIQQVQKLMKTKGLNPTLLKVPYSFHSSQVDPILKDFELYASGASFREPSVPVICPLTERVITEGGAFNPKYLSKHCRQPVNIVRALQAAKASKAVSEKDIFIEIGPHPTVSRMIKAILGTHTVTLPTLQRGKDVWPLLTSAFSSLYAAGAELSWREYHKDFKTSHKVLDLPAYCWDLQEYWIQYKNDWSLRKGDPAPESTLSGTRIDTANLKLSSTIHRIVSESFGDDTGSIVVEADISRPDLFQFVQGHKVNGIPLCTPSVYADIALTLGNYIQEKCEPGMGERLVNIKDMTIQKALIPHNQGPQFLRASLKVDWSKRSATCRFQSIDGLGKQTDEHSHCTLVFNDPSEELNILQSKLTDIKSHISRLQAGLLKGQTYRFNKPMIYKMVGSLAQFDTNYRAIDEIVLDSNALEASSTVSFGTIAKEGFFHTHPAFIDALSQIGGFVMNANDNSNLEEEVFVNHGWRTFRLFERLNTAKVYQTHVKMHETPGNLWTGDVIVLHDERPVAIFGGIMLQGVAKRALYSILSRQSVSREKPLQKQRGESHLFPRPATVQIIAPQPAFCQNDVCNQPAHWQTAECSVAPASLGMNETNSTDPKIIPNKTTNSGPQILGLHLPEVTRKALEILSEESGIAVDDLTDESSFTDIGIDSLLILIITGRLDEELHIRIEPSDFLSYQTVRDLRNHLEACNAVIDDKASLSDFNDQKSIFKNGHSTGNSTPPSSSFQSVTLRPATSVVIQGQLQTCTRSIILFPDGAGSAAPYTSIPRIDPSIAVIGLNCPYAQHPEEMEGSPLDCLIETYLAEIQRRQPHGPYNLGGWSAGGILAFRAAQMLIEGGEDVENLILIDAPAPLKGLDRLPESWYEKCTSIDLFGRHMPGSDSPAARASPPERLVSHFKATIEVLHDYHARPFATCGNTPRVTTIWASDGVFDESELSSLISKGGDSEGLRFLMAKRLDGLARGWDTLFPSVKASVNVVKGANHFTLMGVYAKDLASIFSKALI